MNRGFHIFAIAMLGIGLCANIGWAAGNGNGNGNGNGGNPGVGNNGNDKSVGNVGGGNPQPVVPGNSSSDGGNSQPVDPGNPNPGGGNVTPPAPPADAGNSAGDGSSNPITPPAGGSGNGGGGNPVNPPSGNDSSNANNGNHPNPGGRSNARGGRARQTDSLNGTYNLTIVGHYKGAGTATVTNATIKIECTITAADGSTGTLTSGEIKINGPYFAGAGSLLDKPALINGRLDAAKASRLIGDFSDSSGNTSRIIGTLGTTELPPSQQP